MAKIKDLIENDRIQSEKYFNDSEYFKKDHDEREYLTRRGGTSIRAYQVEDRILDRDPRN